MLNSSPSYTFVFAPSKDFGHCLPREVPQRYVNKDYKTMQYVICYCAIEAKRLYLCEIHSLTSFIDTKKGSPK